MPFGIIASPFLLAAVIDYHLQSFGTNIAENIKENIYVDNVITGTKSVQEALKLYNESKKIFEGAAMNLRDWMSNSKEVLDKIPVHDQAANKNTMKVLGLRVVFGGGHHGGDVSYGQESDTYKTYSS